MKLRELINQTVRMKDEVKQRRTICQLGLENMKDEMRSIKARHKKEIIKSNREITEETDFKELNIGTQKQRDEYIYTQQESLRKEQMEEIDDQKFLIRKAEEREQELADEYQYYKDRFEFLMRIYDIEGEIELEPAITQEREIIKKGDFEDER